MECSCVTLERNKGQFPRVGQLHFLACLTQNNRGGVEWGLIQIGKLRPKGTGDSFQAEGD